MIVDRLVDYEKGYLVLWYLDCLQLLDGPTAGKSKGPLPHVVVSVGEKQNFCWSAGDNPNPTLCIYRFSQMFFFLKLLYNN